MYLRILKKDLKRRKTMNCILLIFITLAALFIAGSTNNIVTVSTALDRYFEKAHAPDSWFLTTDSGEFRRFEDFAAEYGYDYAPVELIQIDPKDVQISGKPFEYSNTLCLSALGGTKIFDRDGTEITEVRDGEIYVTAETFHSDKNDFYDGCKILVKSGNAEKEFTLKSYTKDVLFGSPMVGMSHFLVSEADYQLLSGAQAGAAISYACCVYTDDSKYADRFSDLNLNVAFLDEGNMLKKMYIMDMLVAAVMLIVSACLILISMVILRFTISFTLSGEYREIGVMKAIGISNTRIRGLYITKYLAISVTAAVIGFFLSIPFGRMMLGQVSQNIILEDQNLLLLNLACSAGTAAIVVLFCYLCTRKVRTFSPVDAIRSGQTGERYRKKGFLRLSKGKVPPICFMAANDILSGLRRYASMLIIFTLGILLIIIPINTINTLRSDSLIQWFNMARSDLVISQELVFTAEKDNKQMVLDRLERVRADLAEEGLNPEVFEEVLFRLNISHGSKKTSSMAFQGMGDVTADQYAYLEGSPPQNSDEVAISYIISERIGASIGDQVEIVMGAGKTKTYLVTAINQSMNNLGEGIRFYQEEELDYRYAAGCFGIQLRFKDHPDAKALGKRHDQVKALYPDMEVCTAGEYINDMIGDSAGQIERVKNLIVAIVLCINMLVAVLMVKSFLAKEKSEIAVLRAIGFKASSLALHQAMRIGMVLVLSAALGTLLSTPLSRLTVEPIFRLMGAYDIEFQVHPLEVYVLYPLFVLAATFLAALVSALGVKGISASEASGIE